MSTRSKTPSKALGLAAAITAIAVAVPTAYADPSPTPEPTPAPATTAPVSPAGPVPTSTKVPDPQGSGCDAYRSKHPAGTPGSIDSMALQTGSEALASNPDLSTFSDAISGKLNPAINIVNVLDGGPYVVFAPTNEAFAKLDATTLNTLKTDPVVLLPTLFYHMVLGYLGPNDVKGKMPTQDGRTVTVAGKGGDVTVNGAKVVCAYTAHGAYIYMIDTVLTPPTGAAEAGESTTATTSSTSATATTSAATTSAAPSSTESATPSATSATSAATSAATETASATPTTTTPKAAA